MHPRHIQYELVGYQVELFINREVSNRTRSQCIYGNFKGTILSIVYCSCGIAVLKLWLFLEHRGREWEGGRGKGVVEREREKGREGEGKCERGRGGERSTQYIPT